MGKNSTALSDFRQTWLWRHAFVKPIANITPAEQEFFRDRFLAMRGKASFLVGQISGAMPELTVHDLTHLDALWETASLVTEGAVDVNPAEAFVFGASVLLHDSALSLAAYPNGLDDLKQTIEWKDTITALLSNTKDGTELINTPPSEIVERAVPAVLRQLHAKQSEVLAKQGWKSGSGEDVYLIDDPEIRNFYGRTIGQIAHSHWWPVSRIEQELSENLGACPGRTKSLIDKVKLACLLRIADALHLDQRRAPRFLRVLMRPQGHAADHWTFQERLAAPHIEHDSVVFTAGEPFTIFEANAWWLAYDTISAVNRELQDVDLLLQNRERSQYFKARKVKGAGSPESLARTIPTEGWRPVDTQLRVTDIPKVVETLGGAKLYGDDATVVLRELIQNSSDAIQARRRYQKRREDWGTITVALTTKGNEYWLTVEDSGIGMSEQVMTGPLIDFGTSFWRSTLATQEFPGLIANGMNSIGRYGIGFFSVFMLGSVVRVISKRFDRGDETARLLEFRDGTTSRPILSPIDRSHIPVDGGTRVEIRLNSDPRAAGGLLKVPSSYWSTATLSLQQLVASIAPSVNVSINVEEDGVSATAINFGDWLHLKDEDFIYRLDPFSKPEKPEEKRKTSHHTAMRLIKGAGGTPLGRAYIKPSSYFDHGGWVTIGGLRATRLKNIQGVLVGETLTASRNTALPTVSKEYLAEWATEQARIIATSNSDDEYKAICAEIVLECGGELEGLPILCLGGDEWLSSEELINRLKEREKFIISFNGEFSYDEDQDDVHPREFRNNFEVNSDIAIVPKHKGAVLEVGRQSWPRSITGKPSSQLSNLATTIHRILHEVWGDAYEEDSDFREVGEVEGTSILREVSVFRRTTDN